ncbi:unnamed protein product [Prunus armeniaca]
MSKSGSDVETDLSKVNMDRGGKSKRERSRDVVAMMEKQLSNMEIAVVEFDQRLEEDVLTKGGFEAVVDELQGQFQGALNSALDSMRLDVQTKLDHFLAELTSLREEVKDVKGDWALCKEAVLNKTRTPKEPKVLDSFKPKSYNGKREVKELDTFLWNIERYFKYLKLEDDEPKINTATLFLTDNALMWWRRRSMEIEQGTFTLETWDEFKKDIMLHFYPENAKYEAKEKLRWLKQTGNVKDYVAMFTNLLFEVPSMMDEDKLMYFMSGLHNWAKLELQRRHVQTLSEAIAAAESLVEFKKKDQGDSKFKGKKDSSGSGGGDNKPKEGSKSGDKSDGHKSFGRKNDKGDKGKDKSKLACYLCDGAHMIRDCPQKKALNAMNQEKEEEAEREVGMGAIHRFNALQAKGAQPQVQAKGVMFVDAMVNGKTTRCLVDTGASHNFMSVQEAKRLGCRVSKEAGSMKTVNSTAKPIDGVARGVELHIATWKGVADFSMISMDDYDVVLGMEFMDKVKAFSIPFYNTMCIAHGGAMPCMVPVVRQQGETKLLSAMQFSKSCKKGEPTFLATMKMDIVQKEVQPVPKAVEAIPKAFADVMPKELPKTLPPRRKVDHAFDELKRAPMEESILRLPDLSKPFEVHTDASDSAIGGVLMQDGHPLAFKSRKLNDMEQRIREGLLHDPQSLLEIVKDGKTRRFWHDDGVLYATRKMIYVPRWDNLRHYVSANQRDWAKLLDVAQFSYNLQRSESTRSSPFELATGQQPMTPNTVVSGYTGSSPAAYKTAKEWQVTNELARAQLEKATRTMKKWADKHRRDVVFQPGDMVFVKLNPSQHKSTRKLHKALLRRYEGPFPIIR